MGVVTYQGPANEQVTLSTGQVVLLTPGVDYTFPDVDCTSLLAQYPTLWVAGDAHTATLVPPNYAVSIPMESFVTAAYSSTVTYMRGQIVNADGSQYICIADNTLNLDPATSPANWVQHLPSGLATVGSPPSPDWMLRAWTLASAFRVVSAARDVNEALTTASVVWPDGATGTFTTDIASVSFPGAVDAYHVTYVYGTGPTTKTITQTAVTRDAAGAVTAQPALTIA